MKKIKHTGWLLLAVLLFLPVTSFSQDVTGMEDRQSYFEERAKKDAEYEQLLRFQYVEDEIDYWKDQKNFEKALKKLSYSGYQVYLKGKSVAYFKHELHCTETRNHGDYYYSQATFYHQYGEQDYTLNPSTVLENITTGIKPQTVLKDDPK